MANEILVKYPTPSLANAIYATIGLGNTQTWNTSGTPAFEADNAAHWAAYAVFGADASGTGKYLIAMPAGIAAGTLVTVQAFKATTPGTAALGDAQVAGPDSLYWDGTLLTTPTTLFSGGLAAQPGDGVSNTVTGTSLLMQSGTPKYNTVFTSGTVEALSAATNPGAYAVITGTSGHAIQFSGWVNGTPTAPVTYLIRAVAAGTASDPLANDLSTYTTPGKAGYALGQIAGISTAVTGSGFFEPGIITAVADATHLTVSFPGTRPRPEVFGAGGCYLNVTGGAARIDKVQITGAAVVDSTHLAFTLAVPASPLPSVNDTCSVG